MKKLNNEKIKQMLEEQERFELPFFKEEEQRFYAQLFQTMESWPDEEQSIVDPVMRQVAELEDREESKRYGWVVGISAATVTIATILTYYFFLPADFYQALAYLKAHFPIVLFSLCMFLFVQFADHKWIRKTVK